MSTEGNPSPEQIAQQFELAKLDYARLGVQEQSLMDKREVIWTKFIAILVIPSGYAGIVELKGAIYLLALVPFFIACIALDVKHDEQVLRYDVRKHMKRLAAAWGFANHDSKYSEQDGSRWWQGYYKYGKAAAFLAAELIATVIVCWYFRGIPVLNVPLSIPLTALNAFFIIATAWCML
jgi:hypothetical protein